MRRRSLVLGAIVVGAYLVVLALTVGLRDDHVRPLYDGFAPPPSYQWVDPPSFFSSGNVKPKPVVSTIKLRRDGSEAAGVATPDGQFVVNLARGAIEKSPGATKATVQITPLAPSQLPKLPDGMRANGNVYRLHLRYETGADVKHLSAQATLVLQVPELGNNLFVAGPVGRGAPWRRLDSTALPPNQLSLTASLPGPGAFVAGTSLPELVGPSSSSSHAVVIGIAVAVLAVLLLVAAFILVRRRRRVNTP